MIMRFCFFFRYFSVGIVDYVGYFEGEEFFDNLKEFHIEMMIIRNVEGIGTNCDDFIRRVNERVLHGFDMIAGRNEN